MYPMENVALTSLTSLISKFDSEFFRLAIENFCECYLLFGTFSADILKEYESFDIQGTVNKFNYVCSIENFSQRPEKTGKEITLPTFIVGVKDISEWRLQIYPSGGREESKDYISVFLVLKNPDKAKARLKFSILNDEEEEKNVREHKVDEFVKNGSQRFSNFIKKKFLLDESNGLLIDDKLKILCKAEITDPNDSDSPINHKSRNTTINVHIGILAARSPTFCNIFNSTSKNSKTNIIEIKIFSVEVVKEMLGYIYKNEISNLRNMPCEVLEIAVKYELD
uniref:Speckle-type POZ protein-like (inferred by orthology to a human protein) n=1 Tax=Strongyloides venezuelensis TaxID=75913 RepID=A0A0K0FNX5_STRVS